MAITIGAAQVESLRGDVDANIERHIRLVEIDGAAAAAAIRADTSHASQPPRAAARGATVYGVSMLLSPSDFELVIPKLRGYAREHSMAVVLANHGAPSSPLDSEGGSAVWDEEGSLLARLDGLVSGLVAATNAAAGRLLDAVRASGA